MATIFQATHSSHSKMHPWQQPYLKCRLEYLRLRADSTSTPQKLRPHQEKSILQLRKSVGHQRSKGAQSLLWDYNKQQLFYVTKSRKKLPIIVLPNWKEEMEAPKTTASLAVLSQDQRRQLKQIFQLFDDDGTERLSLEELRQVMNAIGKTMDTKQLISMIASVNCKGTSFLNFNEFVQLMERLIVTPFETHEIAEVFTELANNTPGDDDDDMSISTQEFEHLMQNYGERFSKAEVDKMLAVMTTVEPDVVDRISLKKFELLFQTRRRHA